MSQFIEARESITFLVLFPRIVAPSPEMGVKSEGREGEGKRVTPTVSYFVPVLPLCYVISRVSGNVGAGGEGEVNGVHR